MNLVPGQLAPWLLLAHVLGAIIAFGATFTTFPLLGAMAGREPAHREFAVRASKAIGERFTIPFAILQGITGLALIDALRLDVLATGWLGLSIVLYVIAIGYSIFVQVPAGTRMLELMAAAPRQGATPGSASAGAPAAPAGPPPELAALARGRRRGGLFLAALVVAITYLMVMKPF